MKKLVHIWKWFLSLFKKPIVEPIVADDNTMEIEMVDYEEPHTGTVGIECESLMFCKSIQSILDNTLYDTFIFNDGQMVLPFRIRIHHSYDAPFKIRYIATYSDGEIKCRKYNGDDIYFKLCVISDNKCLLEKVQIALVLDDTKEEHIINLFAHYNYDLDKVMDRIDSINMCDKKGNPIASFDGYSVKRVELPEEVLFKFEPMQGDYMVNLYTKDGIAQTINKKLTSKNKGILVPIDKTITRIALYKFSKGLTDAQSIRIY